MDGYIDFVQRYNSSNDQVSMAADYAKWMSQYPSVVDKIDKMDQSKMTDADVAYYLEVIGRVFGRLSAEEVCECSFCRTNFSVAALLRESDELRRDKVKYRAEKEMRADALEAEKLRFEAERELASRRDREAYKREFKEGGFSKALVIFAVLGVPGVMSSTSGRYVQLAPLLVAFLQIALCATSWLMGMQIIHKPRQYAHKAIGIAGLVMPLVYIGAW